MGLLNNCQNDGFLKITPLEKQRATISDFTKSPIIQQSQRRKLFWFQIIIIRHKTPFSHSKRLTKLQERVEFHRFW